MIEPTESESKVEIDRFCKAMISIKSEIDLVGEKYSIEDNPLVNAPHTAEEMVEDKWKHCYSKKVAFYPDNRIDDKYWPPVKLIYNVYGDRNLFCACPPIEDFEKISETD